MPSFVGILEGINIRSLRPVVVTVEHQEDSQAENNESKVSEEPEEIAHKASEAGPSYSFPPSTMHGLFAFSSKNVLLAYGEIVSKKTANCKSWRVFLRF